MCAVQLSKTGWMEKVVRILETIAIRVTDEVIGLYRNTGHLHEIVGKCRNLKLRGTITSWWTILICITGFIAIVLVLL